MHAPTLRQTCCELLATFVLALLVALPGATSPASGADKSEPAKSDNAQAPATPESAPELRRVSVEIDADAFGEGWKQTVPLEASGGDAYLVSVNNGWLHVKRHNEQGDLDWHIVLAKVDQSELPTIEVIPRARFLELSYAGGRYFIRETGEALRAVRQRKTEGEYVPASELVSETIKPTKAWGRSRLPQVTLSDWRDDEWCYLASGLDGQHLDAVVRLNPLEMRKPGHGVHTMVGGYVHYFHGRRWMMDDGELLVALRTLEADYRRELARRKIRANLPDGAPPEIIAAEWLNTDEKFAWSDLKGKVVLLDFWGTWCTPCIKKLPKVQRLHDRFAEQGLVVIGIHSSQGSEECPEFVEQHGVTFPIAIDSGQTAESYAITSWPTVFVIDKTGKVVVGYTNSVPPDEIVEQLLSSK